MAEGENRPNNSGITRRGFIRGIIGLGASIATGGAIGKLIGGGAIDQTTSSEKTPLPTPMPQSLPTQAPQEQIQPIPTPAPREQLKPIPTPPPQEQPMPAPTPLPIPTHAPVPLKPKNQMAIQIDHFSLPVAFHSYSLNYSFYLLAIFILMLIWSRRKISTCKSS